MEYCALRKLNSSEVHMDDSVLHNFPLKYIYVLIYAYKNYYFNIYLKQKCKNKPNINLIEDLVKNANEDNVLDLSLNILKKRYNYKKKKKRILFDTSESINSNLSFDDKKYNEEGSNKKKNKNSNIHDHTNLSGNENTTDGISTINPNNDNNNSNVSVIRSNGNNNSNNNYLASKREEVNPINLKSKVYGFSKYYENGKYGLPKWRKNLNLANKNENVNCNEENNDDQSENYSEHDIIFLIHYFMHKFVFNKDGKKKIKLTMKQNLIEKLEKLEKEALKMESTVKSSNNHSSNAESFDKNDITDVCKNMENSSFYSEQVIKSDEKEDEKKKNINNNDTYSEKEDKTSHNVSENGISLPENCKSPEHSCNKIKSDDISCLAYHNDIKMVIEESKDNDNNTCVDIGIIKDKTDWILEKTDQSENNNISNNEITNSIGNKDHTNLESSNNSIKWGYEGDKACDKTRNESEIESFNEEMTIEIEKKKIYEIIENYFYKKNIYFNVSEIFYPFSDQNVDTRKKRKNKNKKLNKPLPSVNKCASVIEAYDNKLSEQKHMKNKSLLSKLKKGLNLLLKHEKTRKKGKNKNFENSTSYVNNNYDENENYQINNDLKRMERKLKSGKYGKDEYNKESTIPMDKLKNNQENLKANVLKKCLLDVIDYSEMCMFSNNDNKNNFGQFPNKTKFNIGGNDHIINPNLHENNINQTYLDHQNDINNNDNRRNNYNNFQNINNRMINGIDQRCGNELNNSRVYNNIYGNGPVNMQNPNIGDNRNKEMLGNYNVNTNPMLYNNSGEYLKNHQAHHDAIHNNNADNNTNLLQNRSNYLYNGRNNTNMDNNMYNHSMINPKDAEFHEKNKNMHMQNMPYNNIWPTNMYGIPNMNGDTSNGNSFMPLDPMNNQIERNCKTSGLNYDTNDMTHLGNKRNIGIYNGIENENRIKCENMNYLNNNIPPYMYNNCHMPIMEGDGMDAKLNQRGCRRGRGRGRMTSRINNNDYILGTNIAPPRAKRGRKPLGKHLGQKGPRGRKRHDEINNNPVPNILNDDNEENNDEKKNSEEADECNDKTLKYHNKDNDDDENNGDNDNYEPEINGYTSRTHTNVNPNNSENNTSTHNNNNNTTHAKENKETSKECSENKTSSYLGKDDKNYLSIHEENENNKKNPKRLSNSENGNSSKESIHNYNMKDDQIDLEDINKDEENRNPLHISNSSENGLIKYRGTNNNETILNLEENLNMTSLNSKVKYSSHTNHSLNKIEKRKNSDNNKNSKSFSHESIQDNKVNYSHKNGYVLRNAYGYINSGLGDKFDGSMTNFYNDSNKNKNSTSFRDNKNQSLQEDESDESTFTKMGLASEKDAKQTKIKKTRSNFNTVLGVPNAFNLASDGDTIGFENFNSPNKNKHINNYSANNNSSYLKGGTLICNKVRVLNDDRDNERLDFQINKQTYKTEYGVEENNKNKAGTKIKNSAKQLFENLEGNQKVLNKNQGTKRRANKNVSIEDDEDCSLDGNSGRAKKLKNVDKHDIYFDEDKYEQIRYPTNNEMDADDLIDEYENVMNNKNKNEKNNNYNYNEKGTNVQTIKVCTKKKSNQREHNEEQINIEIDKSESRNKKYINNTLCNSKESLYGSPIQNETNLDRENFNYASNITSVNKELASNETGQNNGDCSIENFSQFDENDEIIKSERVLRNERSRRSSLQHDDLKRKKKKNEYELNDNANKLNSSSSYNCTDIKSQDNDQAEEIEFYNNDNMYTIEKKKIFEDSQGHKESNKNDTDICNDDESINDLNEIGLDSINSKRKGRRPKTTILKSDKVNISEDKPSNKNFDETFILNKEVDTTKVTDSKRRTKASKRHQDLNFRVEKIETGAYNENGEKVSGVWYDTNRRLWRVMYIENDKRKTRGFSPRIYGFNAARDMAVQLKYEMNKKNKK
ncbi:transcription factor with AP2 domain(s), putative [Plasmodium vinckei petteri]|uniref:Transcription factor with AP2 domain(S), putative n=1 Tax=Plasmodium vinckei petteri TaxID=138298 RepID=A0A6V7TC16_PLAVN|nr:transcription factor with AP2 domain(s), putative [Plasmodium vinckei petteri]